MQFGLTTAQIKEIKAVLQPFAAKITKVGVFGSRAVGNYQDYSDLDLVLYGTLTAQDHARLITLFNDSLLPIKIDVHIYELIDYAPLKAHIDDVVKLL
jgi:uncharacterized protein